MNTAVIYNLSQTDDFNKLFFTDELNDLVKNLNKTECTTSTGQKYNIIRYDKNTLCCDNIPTYGMYRSVVVNSDRQVVCFSPPKSINADDFIKKYSTKTDILIAEEFVEGTMINVFWDSKIGLSGAWEISRPTRLDDNRAWSGISLSRVVDGACRPGGSAGTRRWWWACALFSGAPVSLSCGLCL
jgi:hypothetical protein